MTGLTRPTAEQLDGIYRRLAREARYRPAAPSDGFGHIPKGTLNLNRECLEYAYHWADEEDTGTYWAGCCNFNDRPAMVFIVEAARNLCGMADSKLVRKLLQMAIDELDARPERITLRDQKDAS